MLKLKELGYWECVCVHTHSTKLWEDGKDYSCLQKCYIIESHNSCVFCEEQVYIPWSHICITKVPVLYKITLQESIHKFCILHVFATIFSYKGWYCNGLFVTNLTWIQVITESRHKTSKNHLHLSKLCETSINSYACNTLIETHTVGTFIEVIIEGLTTFIKRLHWWPTLTTGPCQTAAGSC